MTDKPQLKSFIARIENLEAEKREILDDVKSVYAEAKDAGLNVPALKAVIRLRREDFDKRAEQERIIEEYMAALGMLASLPLGQSAIARAAPIPAKLPETDTSRPPFHPPPDSDEPRVADPN